MFAFTNIDLWRPLRTTRNVRRVWHCGAPV